MASKPAACPPDLLAEPRERLLQTHVIHDFDLRRVLANLDGCYGRLMQAVYHDMLSLIVGTRVIDCGCGFGQFSRIAIEAGFSVRSIDLDEASLSIARDVQNVPCIKESAYAVALADGTLDTAVCCDSIQHLDLDHFAPEMLRLGVKRIIVYDSNIENPLLNSYRAAAGHRESNYRTATEIAESFGRLGYERVLTRFENVLSLPLSGGFQRRPVPVLGRWPAAVHAADRLATRVARALKIQRRITFRFLMVLDRSPAAP